MMEQNGPLYHLWEKKQQPGHAVEQLLLPKQYYQTVCELAHSITIAGHLGRDKTISRITQQFYWSTVYNDVAEYCRRCQRTSKVNQLRVPLVPLPVIKEPFERIAMDIVGPLPRSKRGNRYILVVCDYATRYPEAIPLHFIDTGTVADHLIGLYDELSTFLSQLNLYRGKGLTVSHDLALLLVQLFSRVGILREILTDQGTNFMSQLLKELYNLLHISQIRTSPYHLQTNSLVERFNKTLNPC